jgi:hypothetical protein
MSALELMREEVSRLYNPDRVTVEQRRKLVKVAKQAKKKGLNPRAAIHDAIRQR